MQVTRLKRQLRVWHRRRRDSEASWLETAGLHLAKVVQGKSLLCGCGEQTLSSHRFESGAIVVDNEEDEKFTVVSIAEGKERVSALLDVASAMTGIGVIIHEAIIQASTALHPCRQTPHISASV